MIDGLSGSTWWSLSMLSKMEGFLYKGDLQMRPPSTPNIRENFQTQSVHSGYDTLKMTSKQMTL